MGRWDITATKQMKKLMTLFVAVFATCVLFAQEKQYLIKVNYSVVYEFRDYAGRVLSSQSGYDSYATFTVCAETEGEARQKAIEWQLDFNNHNYSYSELVFYGDYFFRLAKRYGLIKEFRENDDVNQTQLAILCSLSNITDYERKYVLPIYGELLGGSSNSILFDTVREKNS